MNLKVSKSVVRLCQRVKFYNKDIKSNSFAESQTVLKEDQNNNYDINMQPFSVTHECSSNDITLVT